MDQFFIKILNNFLESISPSRRAWLGVSTIILISFNAFPTSSYPKSISYYLEKVLPWIHFISFVLFLILFIWAIITYLLNNAAKRPSIGSKEKNVEHYTRVGERHFDIPLNKAINKKLKLCFEIVFAEKKQNAVLYFQFEADNNQAYWIGFAINVSNNSNYKTSIERTEVINIGNKSRFSKVINIEDVISEKFEEFGENQIVPRRVVNIRLRASDNIRKPVDFYYYFSES